MDLKHNRLMLALAAWAFIATLGGVSVSALLPAVVFRNLYDSPAALGIIEAGRGPGKRRGWPHRRRGLPTVLGRTSARGFGRTNGVQLCPVGGVA